MLPHSTKEGEGIVPSWWSKYQSKALQENEILGLDLTEEDVVEQFILEHIERGSLVPGSTHRISENGDFIVKVSKSRDHGMHEICVLNHLQSKLETSQHVAPLLGSCSIDSRQVLVFQDIGQPLTQDEWTDPQVMAEVIRAVLRIHASGVVNGDFKPNHVFKWDGRIVIIDWDSAAFTNENGAVRPKWLPEGSSRYLEVPNDHFWAAHTGTPAWAAISQHLGYGPSPSGDAESLGYLVLNSLAGLPWNDPRFKNKEVPTEIKTLAACGWSKMSIYKNVELVWPEVPNVPDAWPRVWHAIYVLELSLRTDKEASAVGKFLEFILQILGESAGLSTQTTSSLIGSLAQEKASWRADAGSSTVHAAPQPPQAMARELPAKELDILRFASERSEQLSKMAENRIRTLLVMPAPGESSSGEKTQPACKEYRFWRKPEAAEVDAKKSGMLVEDYSTAKGKPFQALNPVDRSCMPDFSSPAPARTVVSPDGRTEVVAEIIVSKEPRYVEHKFEQLEAAMMRAGICHPLQAAEMNSWGALLFATSCKDAWNKDRTLQVWKVCPRCRVLYLLGGLLLLKVDDEEVKLMGNKMQELTYMTELAENITILKQTVEQLQESDMENKQQLARIWELLKNSGQEGLA